MTASVFKHSPWIHHPEPEEIRAVFRTFGTRETFPAGTRLPHGTGGALVCYLEKGLGAFTFADPSGRKHIFALIIPGRVFGDLDALTANRLNLYGELLRKSTVLVLSREKWEAEISGSAALLKIYAKSAIDKEESHMEGMIANYTRDLKTRLRLFMSSLASAYYVPKPHDWNPMPVILTITEVAQIAGANRSTVSEIISEWLAAGLIRKDGRRLIVHGELLMDLSGEL